MISDIIAFVPARSGSIRIKDKNIKLLNGKPLISYTLNCAKKSKIFKKVFCITDSKKYQKIAKKYGADDFYLRPNRISSKISPDIDWLKWAITKLEKDSIKFKYFAILRPTSPFRDIKMLKKAFRTFK